MPSTQVCMFCRYRGASRQDGAAAPGCPHGRGARVNDGAGPARNALPESGLAAPRHERLDAAAPRVSP